MKTRPRFTLVLLLACCVCCLAAAGAAQRRVMGVVTKDAPVTLLPEPGRTPLATLREGTVVQVLDADEPGWYRISFQDSYLLGDRIGYIRAEHLSIPAQPKPTIPPAATSPRRGAEPQASDTAGRPDPSSAASDARIAEAIGRGRQMGRAPGLRLRDNGQIWTRLNTDAGSRGSTPAFRMLIHTPLSWIEQASSDAAREQRSFGAEDVTDEMAAPVLRIMIYWQRDGAEGGTAPPVSHLVLRSESGDHVVEPLSKETFSEHVLRAAGGRAVFDGLRLTFPIDAVRALRGPAGDRVVVVAAAGPDGSERTVRLTKQHFESLPM